MPPKRQTTKKENVTQDLAQPNPDPQQSSYTTSNGTNAAPEESNTTTNDVNQTSDAFDGAILEPVSNPSVPSAARAGGPSGRGRGRGGRLLSQPKFSGRRSAAARQELEKAEAAKRAAEAASKVSEQSTRGKQDSRRDEHGRGKGRGAIRGDSSRARGRGGYMGESERKNTDVVASGPFSAGHANRKGLLRSAPSGGARPSRDSLSGSSLAGNAAGNTSSSPFGGGRRPNPASRSSNLGPVKQEPGTGPSSRSLLGEVDVEFKPVVRRTEDGGYISSDEDEDGIGAEGVNVEDLAVVDLTKDDGDGNDSLMPVRIARVAHQGRTQRINAGGATNKDGEVASDANDKVTASSSSSEKKSGKQAIKVQDNSKQPFMSVYGELSSDEADNEELLQSVPIEEDRQVAPGSSEAPQSPEMPSHETQAAIEKNRKAKEKGRVKPSISMPQHADYHTPQELEEWERHQLGLEILRSELGGSDSKTADANGDTPMTGTETEVTGSDKRDNKVYLFQLPPVLPDLRPVKVKPDPATAPIDEDTMQVDGSSKEATDTIIISDKRSLPQLASGFVGKLKVHASGRVSLDWGGTSMIVGMGTEASFLQDVIVAKFPEGKDGAKVVSTVGETSSSTTDTTGVAISMGQVKGKFVVTPDWDEILY